MKKMMMLSILFLSCTQNIDVSQEVKIEESECQVDDDCNDHNQPSCLQYYCNNGYCEVKSECDEPLTCPKEFLDCDDNQSNGCETLADRLNCGACGVVCVEPNPFCIINSDNPLPHCDSF